MSSLEDGFHVLFGQRGPVFLDAVPKLVLCPALVEVFPALHPCPHGVDLLVQCHHHFRSIFTDTTPLVCGMDPVARRTDAGPAVR
jgi:hypothetical protein